MDWRSVAFVILILSLSAHAQESTTTTIAETTTTTTLAETTTTFTTTIPITTVPTTTIPTTTTTLPGSCITDSDCPADSTSFECRDGKNGDVFEVIRTYTCEVDICVEHETLNIEDSCASNEECIEGNQDCQLVAECSVDADCPGGAESYVCVDGNVWSQIPDSVCQSGECITGSDEIDICTADEECIVGNPICQPLPDCSVDDDCPGGAESYVCVDGNVWALTQDSVCQSGECIAGSVEYDVCIATEECIAGQSNCQVIPGFCITDSDCPADTTDFECRDGKNGDVFKVIRTYTCEVDICVENETWNIEDSCGTDQDCLDGEEDCVDDDRECDDDNDCDDDKDYQCRSGDVWRYTTTYECIDHDCEEEDVDSEEDDECDPDEYCVDGEKKCLTKTSTTYLYTISTTSTTTTQRSTTSTRYRPPTTTRPRSTTSTSTTTTSTSTTSTSMTTTSLAPEPTFMDKLLFRRPLENVVDLIYRILYKIALWD